MLDYPDSIGVMYPADFNVPDAHCTVIYLGEMQDAEFTKEDLVLAMKRLALKAPGEVKVLGYDLFGKENDILVIRLDDSLLKENFDKVQRTLAKIGAENKSSFPDYNPHVTVKEHFKGDIRGMVDPPEIITLGAPEIWWGDEHVSV